MPPTMEEWRVGTMVVLGEAQLLLMRPLVLQLNHNGTPAAQLVRLTAQLDQLEASVTQARALLRCRADRPGRRPIGGG